MKSPGSGLREIALATCVAVTSIGVIGCNKDNPYEENIKARISQICDKIDSIDQRELVADKKTLKKRISKLYISAGRDLYNADLTKDEIRFMSLPRKKREEIIKLQLEKFIEYGILTRSQLRDEDYLVFYRGRRDY